MNSLNKTFLPANKYTHSNWFIIDCKGQKLGRLATIITSILKGKTKSQYFPSIDLGDNIILINANSILINEKARHFIVNYPGRPGHSLKIKKASNCLAKFTIERAIKGMLAKTEKKKLMRRVRIYENQYHPHKAQNPKQINISI